MKPLVKILPDEIDLAQKLIRFPTVNPPGNERPCIEFIAAMLADYGVSPSVLAKDPNRPNLVARIRGRGEAPPLLLYGHVDVVPVEQQKWSVPPFEALLKEGFIWGRGALDMKGGIAMLIVAFLGCLENPPPGDVVLAIVSDEEAGGHFGAGYLVQEHAELFAGIRHALGEFGGFTLTIGGGRFLPIQIAEKRHCKVDIKFSGPGGHASVPPKKTAIGEAARFLANLDRSPMPIRISTGAREMIKQLSGGMGNVFSKIIVRSLANRVTAPIALRILGPQARMFEPLIRTVITPTVIRGGTKRNVVPECIDIEFDVRMVPDQTATEVEAHIKRMSGDHCSITIQAADTMNREVDLSQFQLLATIAKELDPSAIAIPMLLPGVTDSRHFDVLGIQTYGFLPMVLPKEMNFMSLIHGADERIPADTLRIGAKGIATFLARYGG